MKVIFEKFQGTGNDFIIIDARHLINDLNNETIRFLCNRHFGIGADGLILLYSANDFDFEMKYFNSDGIEGTMCGNGGRCIAAFARKNKISGDNIKFKAIDGSHSAIIISQNNNSFLVKLKLSDVNNYHSIGSDFIINTGSPHYVKFVNNIDEIDVLKEGAKIRNDKNISERGLNVNFVSVVDNHIFVRTYERGVEAETLSCGTGVTASALAYYLINKKQETVKINTKGGNLTVSFKAINNGFMNIYLEGNADFIFKGEIEI